MTRSSAGDGFDDLSNRSRGLVNVLRKQGVMHASTHQRTRDKSSILRTVSTPPHADPIMSFAPALMEAVLLLDERHLRDILTRIPDANERAATVNTPNNIGLTALMMAASYNHALDRAHDPQVRRMLEAAHDRIRLRNHMGLIPASPSQTRRMM
jgi:ankyrin repeat protein